MPKEQKLRHCKKPDGSPSEFTPGEIHLLYCESEYSKLYKYQELMIGICPKCKLLIMAWLGIDFKGSACQYYEVSEKKFELWRSRIRSSKVRPEKPVIDRKKHSPVEMKTVIGSVREKNSGKWMLRHVAAGK